jgi:hypothetical protein
MRKRIVMTLLSSLVITMLLPATNFAVSSGAINKISGVVTNDGKTVVGAQVTVVCNGNTKNTTSGKGGAYSVRYTITQCPDQAIAHVTATDNGYSGSNSGEGEVNENNLKLTEKLNTQAVPVLGLVTGATAVVLGSAGYAIMQRR